MIPSEICLDANVFITAMIPEEDGHEASFKIIQMIQERDIPLFEPAIVLFEVISILHRKVSMGELEKEEGEELADLFFQLPLLLQWQPALMKKAVHFARELGLKKIYDCTYLAVAQAREIPLITLDQEFIKKSRKIFRKIQSAREFMESVT